VIANHVLIGENKEFAARLNLADGPVKEYVHLVDAENKRAQPHTARRSVGPRPDARVISAAFCRTPDSCQHLTRTVSPYNNK
jgi:hypothetical protein